MIALAAVVAVAAATGVGAEHGLGSRAVALARWLMAFLLWVVLPIVAFFNIAALELTARVGAGVAYAYAALAVTLALAYALGTWILRLERASVGALMIVSGFANTGFLGLPFVVALLGFSELPNAVAYDVLVSALALVSIGFTVGAAFGTLGETPRARVRSFFTRNPPLYATVGGFLAPDVLAPGWAVSASQILVLVTVPVGFFAVGVILGSERRRTDRANPRLVTVATAVGLKIVVAPAVVLLLSVLIIEAPRAYLSQAGMASAVNVLVVADTYGLDRGLVAAGIAWSTGIVVAAGLVVSLA